jgi:hypothetical protein
VSERVVPSHQRTATGPPSTPAERVAELTREVVRLEQQMASMSMQMEILKTDHNRWRSMQKTSFGGVTMAQIPVDLTVWEAVLNENRHLRGIVEIGTWQAGFSLWLDAQAHTRGLQFASFDAVDPDVLKYRQLDFYERLDVFRYPDRVKEIIDTFEPCVVFCDGGNKPRELSMFAPMLTHPNSLIAVHDWGTEMLPEDVPTNLEMMYGEFCEQLESVTRFFRRRDVR